MWDFSHVFWVKQSEECSTNSWQYLSLQTRPRSGNRKSQIVQVQLFSWWSSLVYLVRLSRSWCKCRYSIYAKKMCSLIFWKKGVLKKKSFSPLSTCIDNHATPFHMQVTFRDLTLVFRYWKMLHSDRFSLYHKFVNVHCSRSHLENFFPNFFSLRPTCADKFLWGLLWDTAVKPPRKYWDIRKKQNMNITCNLMLMASLSLLLNIIISVQWRNRLIFNNHFG